MADSRFAISKQGDVERLKENSKNENTLKATQNWLKVWQNWATERKVKRKLKRMKEEKTIFKPFAGIKPHIFGLLVQRVNHYTTRTNHAGNAAG